MTTFYSTCAIKSASKGAKHTRRGENSGPTLIKEIQQRYGINEYINQSWLRPGMGHELLLIIYSRLLVKRLFAESGPPEVNGRQTGDGWTN